MDIFTTLLIIALCLLLEGFFSGSEIGVISADQIKLRLVAQFDLICTDDPDFGCFTDAFQEQA